MAVGAKPVPLEGGEDDRALFSAATAEKEPELPKVEAEEPDDEIEVEAGPADTPVPIEPGQVEPPRQRSPRIPLSEHLAEREKRQAAEAKNAALEAASTQRDRDLADMQRRIAELSQPKEPAAPIDIFADPDGYAKAMEQRFEQRLQARLVDGSFAEAHEQHGPTFEAAYANLQRLALNGDTRLRDQIVNSPNPGKALMRWHRDQEAIRTIGGDLDAFKKKLRDEAMDDPEFRKSAMAKWRAIAGNGSANGANGNGSQAATDLPSLNRATGAGSQASEDGKWESDKELFRSATTVARRG